MLSHPEANGFMNTANLEFQMLKKKCAWEEVPKPTNVKVLPLKWVFVRGGDQVFRESLSKEYGIS